MHEQIRQLIGAIAADIGAADTRAREFAAMAYEWEQDGRYAGAQTLRTQSRQHRIRVLALQAELGALTLRHGYVRRGSAPPRGH